MSRVYLQVKIKSLAAEARIIRELERRWRRREHETGRPTFFGLRAHRVGMVRQEARIALLAYGFIRGRSYASMERTTRWAPDWTKVTETIARFQRPEGWHNQSAEQRRNTVILWSEGQISQ